MVIAITARNRLAIVAISLIASLFLLGCIAGSDGADNRYANTAKPKTHVVEIKDFKFSPTTLQVSAGDSITWKNLDLVPHTATAKDKSWTSPELKSGQSYTMPVSADTANNYFCLYHPSMIATLDVATR